MSRWFANNRLGRGQRAPECSRALPTDERRARSARRYGQLALVLKYFEPHVKLLVFVDVG
jgi:hypothetical protein